MKAMTLRLPDEVHEALRQRAFGQRTSITEIVRQAIDERLTWIDAESSSWCADCRFEEGDNPACCAALAAVPADGETEWEYGESTDPTTPRLIRGAEAWAYVGPTYPIRRSKAGPWSFTSEGEAQR